MIQIPSITAPIFDKRTVTELNKTPISAYSRQTVSQINNGKNAAQPQPAPPRPQPTRRPQSAPPRPQPTRRPQPASPQQRPTVQNEHPVILPMAIPALSHVLGKGQKTPIGNEYKRVRVCFGWNVLDQRCDIDASAFLLSSNGKVLDDSWFVFYSQPRSPDGSTVFSDEEGLADRETIFLDLDKLDPSVKKIVFVLTINEAFEQNLNFSAVEETYVRLLDDRTGKEILSYRLEENSPKVTSMTVAEIYLHNGIWKMNPVGNGMQIDLAGQCAIYGVQVE